MAFLARLRAALWLGGCTALSLTPPASAADLVRILPVTDRILQVQFDEGHLDYHGYNQDRYGNGIKVYSKALNVTEAAKVARYSITSADDPAYATARNPVGLGRKSKGAEFNNIYEPPEPFYLSDISLYLELPEPLQTGKTYRIDLTGLADNRKTWTLVFDPLSLRSETIHVNQLGYQPEARKIAYLSHWMGDFNRTPHLEGGLELDDYTGAAFHLVRVSDGAIVHTGTITARKAKSTPETENTQDYGPTRNFTRADVWQADFSAFQEPGEYRLSVARMGCSFPFEIAEDVYREAYYYASKGLFVERAGIEKEVEPGWVLPRDQHPGNPGKRFFYDPNVKGDYEAVSSVPTGLPLTDTWGWYHDAGDWDGYTSHSTVPACLLLLFELRGDRFQDGDLANRLKYDPSGDWVEEGANGRPDLLDEAAWLIQCYRRARQELLQRGYGTGGVPGYFGRDAGYEKLPSWEDPRDVLVAAETVENTFNYAALAAWYAICLDRLPGDAPAEQADWVAEARAAYQWADDQPGNSALNSQRFAASALYRVTGEDVYQAKFKTLYNKITEPSWSTPGMAEFGALLYALAPDDLPNLDLAKRQAVRADVLSVADAFEVDYAEQNRGYRFGGARPRQRNQLGAFSTPKVLWAAVAHHLSGDAKYLDAVRSTVDYFLGGNEMNLVWMTNVGEQSEYSTFHLDSWYSRDFNSLVYRNPIATGLVPYGTHYECDWFGCGWNWIGDEDFSRSTAYPDIDQWPVAETRFQNRHNIPASEFTVHQNQNHAIFATGYLVGEPGTPFSNPRPTVSLNLSDQQPIGLNRPFTLTATASPDTRRVVYYYDWHLLGESEDRANQFAYVWDVTQTGLKAGNKPLLTAVAYDDRGQISLPSEAGDHPVEIVAVLELTGLEAVLEGDGGPLGADWFWSSTLGFLFNFPGSRWTYLHPLNSYAYFPESVRVLDPAGFWMFLADANGLNAAGGQAGAPATWSYALASHWSFSADTRSGWLYLASAVDGLQGWTEFRQSSAGSFLVAGDTQVRLR